MFNLNEGLWYYIIQNQGISKNDWRYVALTVAFAFMAMAAGYLLGSINSAILISKTLYGDDIRKHGSGNAGLTNMLRTYGKKAAGLTLLGDILKTALAIVVGSILGGFGYWKGISLSYLTCELPLNYMAGFCAVIGHILPIYYGFKGGKGVLCTAAMALILTPVEFVILLGVFVLMVWWSKYVSLGSVTVAVLYPIVVSGHIKIAFNNAMYQNGVMALITIALAIIIVYCHRGNLERISEGTERKLSFKSKKNNDTESK